MTELRNQPEVAELRRQAEQRLSRVIEQSVPTLKPENVTALVHELQVHQIELEMQCHELRRAQAELEESRNTYRELYESIPVGYLTLDRDGRIYDINPTGTALLGWEPSSRPIRNFFAFFSDQDLDRFTLFCRGVVSGQEVDTGEFEMKRRDGSYFAAAVQAAPVKTGTGRGELRVVFKDITRRKEAQETLRRQHIELEANQAELRELTRRLFTAQEDERARIARELHDDYCQRVTTLILEANMLRRGCEGAAPSLAPRLAAMSQKLSDILNDFRTLSHELIPRTLGDTSLAVPIRNLVKEFSQKAGFEIKFFEEKIPVKIPSGTMTTMFRLLQESLCNIVKHANAQHVAVTWGATEQGELELVVVDDGIGFEITRVCEGQKGMGIVGMRERARLVGGTVKIISQPGEGTTVIFSIPLPR
jgi:PAS domain S-box-containing protein